MSKVLYLAFLVVVLVVSTPALAQDGVDVPDCATELGPCGPFINSTTVTPPTECCQPLDMALKNDLSCICNIFSNVEAIQTLSINVTEALTLPQRCGLQFDLITQCQALSDAPTMSPAEAPISGLTSGISLKRKGKKSGASNISWTGSAVLSSFLLCATVMFY